MLNKRVIFSNYDESFKSQILTSRLNHYRVVFKCRFLIQIWFTLTLFIDKETRNDTHCNNRDHLLLKVLIFSEAYLELSLTFMMQLFLQKYLTAMYNRAFLKNH